MTENQESRKRKVRKGTHSCWECRRRKIRCQYASPGDAICTGCRQRGTACVGQEFAEEQNRPSPDRRLAQRLSRLENLMEKLVDKMMPEASNASSRSPSSDPDQLRLDLATKNMNIRGLSISSSDRDSDIVWTDSASTPEPEEAPNNLGAKIKRSTANLDQISRELYELLPPQADMDILFRDNPGNIFIIGLFYSMGDMLAGHAETVEHATRLPDPSSHPVLIAKRLLQLVLAIQHLPPNFDLSQLGLGDSTWAAADRYIAAVSGLVASSDELVGGFIEGLESLMLLAFCHKNSGNLRKAWLACRRAMSLAQLMGLDRKGAAVLSSCDPRKGSRKPPSPSYLWYRVNMVDRYLSLILGLPMGSNDISFAAPEILAGLGDVERVERMQCVITGRIIERNTARSQDAHRMTLEIDRDLSALRESVGSDWWAAPDLATMSNRPWSQESGGDLGKFLQTMNQMYYHTLVIFLHLPYMLRHSRESRWHESKRRCMSSSREVLSRFFMFRSYNSTALCCRHVDYTALVASMTLVLGYLGQQPKSLPDVGLERQQRDEDRRLVEKTRTKMQEIAALNDDKLLTESSEIIRQLLPVIDYGCAGGDPTAQGAIDKCLQLTIPYLGTVNINPGINDEGPSCSLVPLSGPVVRCPFVEEAIDVSEATRDAGTNVFDTTEADAGVDQDNQAIYLTLDPALAGLEHNVDMDFQVDPGVGLDSQGWSTDLFDSEYRNAVWPGLTADADDWILQGVDTTYWSLLNGGFVQNG